MFGKATLLTVLPFVLVGVLVGWWLGQASRDAAHGRT